MLIRNQTPESLWIVCEHCHTAFHPGGHCKCGNIQTITNKEGVTRIEAEDSDAVVYDNE